MVNWTVTDPYVYRANINDLELSVAPAAYDTWSWLLSRSGRAITGGNARTLDEAKAVAERAAEKYATPSAPISAVP
jgi:hypothetical protein